MQLATLAVSLSAVGTSAAPHNAHRIATDAALKPYELKARMVYPKNQASEKTSGDEQRRLMHSKWASDCFKTVPARRPHFLQVGNPGAGMQPDDIEPYQTVLKDGFMMVACVKDAMYVSGDKFGNNKFQYKMGPIANSSIVHYTEIVPKEDRKRMTPDVCFQFCRSVPDMGFFGISNGRDCYCTPHYQAMASDSSSCDAVCEGDTKLMCGGSKKNSIFEMHMCDTTKEDLEKAVAHADAVEHHLDDVCASGLRIVKDVETAALTLQKAFGQIGDPTASNQMQRANVVAGEWIKVTKECVEYVDKLKKHIADAADHKGKNLANYDNRKAAEDATKELNDVADFGIRELDRHIEHWYSAQPKDGTAEEHANQFLPEILDQYYSVMYFVDKEFADDGHVPVTCDGDLIGDPVMGFNAGQCAAACDDKVGECVGFAAYETHNSDGHTVICMLFSKIKTAQYYTGCEEPALFLHQKKDKHRIEAIEGFVTEHKHKVHINSTAESQAACARKSASGSCRAARKATSPNDDTPEHCYLKPNNKWTFDQLPAYFNCLEACCVDHDPNLILDGLTCEDLFGYYPDQETACDTPLMVRNPPVGSKIRSVCSQSCEVCDGPVADAPEITTTTAPAVPITTTAHPVVETAHLEAAQPELPTKIKAMCRAKLSKFSGVSLKPDPSGKSKFALKELTKANRCLDSL